MTVHNGNTARILEALEELGPSTSIELSRHLGLTQPQCSAPLSQMRKPLPQVPQRVYISTWVHDDEKGKPAPRPVYALGNKRDAPKPPKKKGADRVRDWRNKKRMMERGNFVFNLGRII
jgi:hypothetical protein